MFSKKIYSWRWNTLISFSAANVLFFKAWSDLTRKELPLTATEWSYELLSVTRGTYLGILCDVIIVALLLTLLLQVTSRLKKTALIVGAHLILAVTFIFLLSGIRLATRTGFLTSLLGNANLAILSLGLLFYMGRACWLKPADLVGGIRRISLILSPFCVFTTAFAFYGMLSATPQRDVGQIPSATVPPKKHLVIWHIFDELDWRLGFESRPAGLKLPELDRFRNEAVVATQAFPPGSHTSVSIPGYLLGQRVSSPLAMESNSELKLGLEGDRRHREWKEQDNLFTDLKERNLTTGVMGWYLPYCKMLEGKVDFCRRFPHYNYLKRPYDHDAIQSALNFFGDLFELHPSRGLFQIRTYDSLLESFEKTVSVGDMDFLFVHWPVPHAPWIYESGPARMEPYSKRGPDGYFQNLKLVDKTMGKVREVLEKKGLGESTLQIVTSDHPWNTSREYDDKFDPRIPYLVHLPYQKGAREFRSRFDSIVTKKMILAYFDGKIKTNDDLLAWMDRAEKYAIPPKL